jgi:hypothetical protein
MTRHARDSHLSLRPPGRSYPLRPELVESLYYLHQATGDPIWRHFGKGILSALQNRTRVVPLV